MQLKGKSSLQKSHTLNEIFEKCKTILDAVHKHSHMSQKRDSNSKYFQCCASLWRYVYIISYAYLCKYGSLPNSYILFAFDCL